MRHRILRLLLTACLTPLLLNAATRHSTPLGADWRFKQGDPSGAERVDFNDAAWQSVTLPHCWGWEQAQNGENYLRGPGWYRRELDLAAPGAGRRYFIRFEAAGSVADVYLNGKSIGQHRGAFGAFCFEISDHLASSGTNLLAVRVSNAVEPDVAPLRGDFCVFGGLYRGAQLIETDETCFALTDHASSGVAWLQSKVSNSEATLDVIAQISNAKKQKQPLTLVARVLDADGHEVTSAQQTITLVPRVTAPFSIQVTVPKPHLWNGRKDPYLYRAIVELRDRDRLRDSVEQPLGLRYYRADPDKGFFLNGQHYHLHGVNRHQDRQDKGLAVAAADQREAIQLLTEIGCTVFRCAHYQHSDYFYSLCDKAGILVWAEIPQVEEVGNWMSSSWSASDTAQPLS